MENRMQCVLWGTGDGYPQALVGEAAFSWQCRGALGNQKKYRIQILDEKKEEYWDSGWIESSRSENVLPVRESSNGEETIKERFEPESDQDYYVKISVETDEKKIISSEPQLFSTGIKKEEWQGQWLKPYEPEAAAPLFRKEFFIDRDILRARLYLCGLGYQEAYINGKKVGTDFLSPTWTDYRKRVSYVAYDIKEYLQKGENVLGVQLGKGWYGTMVGKEIDSLLFSGQISLTYEDGKKEWIYVKGNDGWLVNSEGPLKQNSIYIGEVYDARAEIKGWNLPGNLYKKAKGWKYAILTEPPEGEIVPQNVEEIGCIEERATVSVKEYEENTHIVDFGQNMAGIIEINIEEPKDREIVIRYSEILDKNGKLNTANLRTAQAKDIYISGGEKAVYRSRFTYHGFRYIEIKGMTGKLKENDVKALVLRNKVAKTGEFKSSNPLINKIQNMCQWTESNNLHGVPTDCPQRDERLGWLNDLTVRAEEAVYNFDMHRFYRKFLQDIADEQGKMTGAITDTVPFIRYGNQPADPVCSSYLILGWLLYMHYGDRISLEKYYEGFAAWTQYLRNSTKNGIVTYSYYGDWASPIAGSLEGSYGSGAVSNITPGELMSTGFLYYNAQLMKKMAEVLEKKEDISKWEKLAQETKDAINREYYHKETGSYAQNSQAANTFMAWLDISPDKKKTVEAIVEDVKKQDIHLTTGNICSRYILEVLTENGYEDLAYALATQTTYPSWGYMAEMGATTIWERWEYVDSGPLLGMASHDHPMYATVSAWFYRYLLGIQVIEPGFSAFSIKPYIPEKLEEAEGSLETVKGRIEVKWNQTKAGEVNLHIQVPFHTRCKLSVPNGFQKNWTLNNKKIEENQIWIEAGCYQADFLRKGDAR